MRVITNEFREAVDKTPLYLPDIPVVANITARPLDSLAAIRAEMEGQLTSSVRWTDSVRWMVTQGITDFVEIGSKDVLTGLIRRIDQGVNHCNIGTPEDIEAFLS
jgi:[acyl-carrier-protein] S-malonyltransferase